MAEDLRRRQKKLERRKAKDKSRKKALEALKPSNAAVQIRRSVTAPILECFTNDALWQEGMSQVVVSRLLDNGSVAFVNFLLDVYCLGVKDTYFDVVSRGRYEGLREKFSGNRKVIKLAPEAARKLVEGAVQYAADLGLPPHPDYRKASRIFGEIDASLCDEEFTYGKNGEPLFIAGPHDSQSRCREIIDTPTASCGPDGFTYILGVGGAGSLPDMLELM